MKKYIIISSIMFSIFALSVTHVFAANSSSTASTGSNSIYKNCINAAKQNRDASINSGKKAYDIAVAQAKTTRSSALSSANSLTDKAQKKSAIKDAQKAYQDKVKVVRKDWSVTKKATNSTYKEATQKCKK